MKRTMAAYLTAAALAVGLAAATATPAACQTVVGDDLIRVSNHGSPVELEIWMDRGEGATYREGDGVGIRFRVNRDCYVVIYNIDTEGFLSLLYPDDPYSDGFVEGGRVYRLPGPRARYDLLAEGPPGVEYVAAVASLSPIADRLPWYLAESYEAYGYKGHQDLDATVTDVGAVRGDPYVAMRDIAYDILPERIHESEYDTDYTYFHVGREHRHPRYLCYDCHGRVDWLDPYYDSCSVFDIRVDIDWYYVSHPTYHDVGPRFWYWRRHDCPSIYVGFPTFWCSLYPRHYYRVYYWEGLHRVGLGHERRGNVYLPPKYRGKPKHWARGNPGVDPRRPAYARGANPGGKHADRRVPDGDGRKYGGRAKPDLPRDVKLPERLARPDGVRLKPKEGTRGRSGEKPAVGSRTDKTPVGADKGRVKTVRKKSARGESSKTKLRIVKKSDGDAGKSKAKVSKRKETKRTSKSKKSSVSSGKSRSQKSSKANKKSDRSSKKSSKSRRASKSK